MKSHVNDHALALHTIMVNGSAGQVEMQVYETGYGACFAMEGSWLEQVPEDGPLYVPDPYNEGRSLQLLDNMDEKETTLVSGEENEYLVDKVVADLKESFAHGDYTTLAELLSFVPDHVLIRHLGE